MSLRMRESQRAAENIRAQLGRQRMSAAELARRLERSEMWVHRRIRGDVDITLEELAEIAVVLVVPLSALLPSDEKASA